jgi:hypothetical protein
MTKEHLGALLSAAGAKKEGEWMTLDEGRKMTFYAGSNGVSLTIGSADAVKEEGPLLCVRTIRGEVYLLALEDVFAASTETSTEKIRKAGFAS